MKDTTSPQKIARKARKIYNKEMKREAEKLGRMLGNYLKPKPRWVPWRVWRIGLGIFIRINNNGN